MSDLHQVITPENVELDYEVAGIGSRFLAIAVDTLIQLFFHGRDCLRTLTDWPGKIGPGNGYQEFFPLAGRRRTDFFRGPRLAGLLYHPGIRHEWTNSGQTAL